MDYQDAALLPIGAWVDQYEIVGHLGQGGFGITYKVNDASLEAILALKEFCPSGLVVRDGERLRLAGRVGSDADYQWARRKFHDEARLLAQLNHTNIVRVRRVFEANNTAYMLLDFVPGSTLEAWLGSIEGPPTQEEMDLIAGPLLSALELVHTNGTWHLDVSPDNILIRSTDGEPILLDFGAARLEIKQRSQLLSAMLYKSGYSPPEQYTSRADSYGPWTDIYAAGATLYRAISGMCPVESISRTLNDELVPARQIGRGRYRDSFLRAIDAALRIQPTARPQTIAAWRAALLDDKASHAGSTILMRRVGQTTRIAHGARTNVKGGFADQLAALFDFLRRHGDDLRRALAANSKRALMLAAVPAVVLALGFGRWVSSPGGDLEKQRPTATFEASADPRLPQLQPPLAPPPTISKKEGRVLRLPMRLGFLQADQQKGWLSANMADVGKDLARSFALSRTSGTFVRQVGEGGTAALGGVLPGDIVLSLNGTLIENVADLRRRVQELAPDTDVTIEVWRPGSEPQNLAEVLRTYAAQGDGHAMNLLGMLYMNGTGVTRNNVEAVSWFRKGAEAKDADATAHLAEMMIGGRGTAKDLAGGVNQFGAASLLGHVEAQTRFIRVTIEARPRDDLPKKVGFVRTLVEEGSASAMVLYGDMYVGGSGVKRDYAEALRWYRRAAELGDATATNSVGVAFAEGQGMPKNPREGLVWFHKAALMGDLSALRNIAYCLDNGLSVDRDPSKAAGLVFLSLASGREESFTDLQKSSTPWSRDFRVALQRLMRGTGLYSGPIDGDLAPTMSAIRALVDRRPRVPSNT